MSSVIEMCVKNKPVYLRVARKYLESLEDAEDCVQEAFIKIIKHKDTYNSSGSIDGWVKRIVRNTAIDTYRKNKSKKVLYNSEITDSYEASDEPEYHIDDDIPIELVYDALDSLSRSYKKVAKMYLIDKYKHSEISDLLGISIGTSKSNLNKAKKNIVKHINKNKFRYE
jgi:RNA polymerase sigma factor (sigma-70 family)